MTHKSLRLIAVLFVLMIIAMSFTIRYVIREHQINDCTDRGGQVVDHPWWSESWADPGCVLPGGVQ